MDGKYVEYITTPKMKPAIDLVVELVNSIDNSATLLNNALENDKYGVVGREAQKMSDLVNMMKKALNEVPGLKAK